MQLQYTTENEHELYLVVKGALLRKEQCSAIWKELGDLFDSCTEILHEGIEHVQDERAKAKWLNAAMEYARKKHGKKSDYDCQVVTEK